MTILFYLKPAWYSFPPSGMPDWGVAKRKRKAQRKLWLEAKKRRQREEEELIILLARLGMYE
jgi:hypothetical protein